MRFLIIFLLAIFPFGQLARFNIPNTEVVLHLNDFVVAFVVCVCLARTRQFFGPLVKPLAFFAVAVVLSLILNMANFSTQQLLTAALYPLRFFVYAGLYFVFFGLKKEEKTVTTRWLLIVTSIMVAFGLAQYIFVPNVAFLAAYDWDDHYFRLIGTFLDPGFTGGILVLGLVLAYLLRNWLIVPTYAAMALTYSRASYFMYLVSFAVIAFYRKSLKTVLVAALVLSLTILILPKSTGEGTKLERENSIFARINNWKQTITVWRQNPIFGVGFNSYRYVAQVAPQSHSGGADSSIFLVLATTGLVGLLAYLYLLGKMWQLGKGSLLFKASFLGIIVHSFFNNTLFYPWVMEWLWLILALQ